MQSHVEYKKKKFDPVTITLTLESEEEVASLYVLFNASVDCIKGSVAQTFCITTPAVNGVVYFSEKMYGLLNDVVEHLGMKKRISQMETEALDTNLVMINDSYRI